MDHVSTVLFSAGSFFVAPFWLLMVLAPRWRFTARVVDSPAIVAAPLLLYGGLILPRLLSLLPAVAHPQLPEIAALLGTPRGATVAWIHLVALDLFVGRWIFLDARARDVPSWFASPVLALTLLFAPLGLGAYLAIRARASRASGQAAGPGPRSRGAIELARRGWAALVSAHRALALVTAGSLALLLACVALGLVDRRQLLGAPLWLKPGKFAASIAMTTPVLAWITAALRPHQDERRRRRVHAAGTLIAVVAALELAVITVQAARGVPSHFNFATRMDAALFETMGLAISLLWLAELYIAVRAFRVSFPSRTRAWAIRLGLVGALAGGAIGFLMPRPTPAQLETLRAHQPTPLIGAHTVGAPDGGPGLPVTRWSTEGGDLRAPHFLGLHALQALPLAAWLLERRRRAGELSGSSGSAAPATASARPIVAFGVGWIGLTLVALGQALRGQPLLAPDGLTLAAAALVLVAAVAMALDGASALATRPSPSSSPRRI
jgi:hypothetical protein